MDYNDLNAEPEDNLKPPCCIGVVYVVLILLLIITGLGKLPKGLTKKEFFNCTSRPRSREIMRIFKDVGLVEELGSGMSRILSVYDKSVFEFTDNFIKITFKFDDSVLAKSADKLQKSADKSGKSADKSGKSADKIQLIVEFLKENEYATTNELNKLLGVESRRTRIILNKMANDNIIIKEGANKNRKYKLKDNS